MLSIYPACFFKEEQGYSVIFPDLNWLSTCGETINEAMAMAVDCLAGYLYLLQKEGEAYPSPSAIESINPAELSQQLDLPPAEAFVTMVSVDIAAYAKQHFEKSVKKTLTIPAWLNKASLEENINFSQVLQEALLRKLNLQNRSE